jgi:hypothetical protein
MNPTKNKNGAKTINQIKNIIRLTFEDDFMLYLFLFKLNYYLKAIGNKNFQKFLLKKETKK